ncbi:MAG: PaaI family thioesterase [bacterium]|nr:PaaI family thioesterase [bacterium]
MPGIDFSSHDPDFSQEQIDQCARIIGGLREINSRIVRLGGSLEALTSAGDRVEALLASLDEVTQARAMEFRFEFDPADPNSVLPFNAATGEFNPIAPAVKMTLEGDRIVAKCTFSNCHESAPDTVQGGLVATVFDELLAIALMTKGKAGPTLWIKTTFLKPVPLGEALRFEADVAAGDGKKFIGTGSCYRGDTKIAEAECLMLGAYDIRVLDSDAA